MVLGNRDCTECEEDIAPNFGSAVTFHKPVCPGLKLRLCTPRMSLGMPPGRAVTRRAGAPVPPAPQGPGVQLCSVTAELQTRATSRCKDQECTEGTDGTFHGAPGHTGSGV